MNTRINALAVLVLTVSLTATGKDKITVVASLPTFGSIAKIVGGDRVDVFSIATGYQNPHFVDPKPSYILRLSKADLFITTGLDLEAGWVPALLSSSRNGRIQPGGEGYIDASKGMTLLEVPSSADRAQGDIHAYGNPHYWLDPLRGKQIAATIRDGLARISPGDTEIFEKNLRSFEAEIDRRTADWVRRLSPLRGREIVAYHNEWPYLEERFGFSIVEFLEPKPGIPPTPGQLKKVISTVESRKIPFVITSPYFTLDAAELVANRTGARIAVLATSVGAFPAVDNYYDLFEYNVNTLLNALNGAATH